MSDGRRAPIAVALDAPDMDTAARWAASVERYVSCVKIGLELFSRHGPDVVSAVRGGTHVDLFLDLKLHDIPATVAGAVARSALAAFAPLEPAALVLTHADETDHLGPLVELAVDVQRPLSYVASGPSVGADLLPADPAALAARLLP